MRNIQLGQFAQVYFTVKLIDNVTPALSEAGGQPQLSLNGAGYDATGISTLIPVGYGDYFASLNGQVALVVGDVLRSRYKGPTTAESEGDSFLVVAVDGQPATQSLSIDHYGDVVGGDVYFNARLEGKKWKSTSPPKKLQALVSATELIDKLNYRGSKTYFGQKLQFPRKNVNIGTGGVVCCTTEDTRVPEEVVVATYIIADKLLAGFDVDIESDSLTVIQHKYDKTAVLNTREFIPEHIRSGIPSQRAWGLLKPFLRSPLEVVLSRI